MTVRFVGSGTEDLPWSSAKLRDDVVYGSAPSRMPVDVIRAIGGAMRAVDSSKFALAERLAERAALDRMGLVNRTWHDALLAVSYEEIILRTLADIDQLANLLDGGEVTPEMIRGLTVSPSQNTTKMFAEVIEQIESTIRMAPWAAWMGSDGAADVAKSATCLLSSYAGRQSRGWFMQNFGGRLARLLARLLQLGVLRVDTMDVLVGAHLADASFARNLPHRLVIRESRGILGGGPAHAHPLKVESLFGATSDDVAVALEVNECELPGFLAQSEQLRRRVTSLVHGGEGDVSLRTTPEGVGTFARLQRLILSLDASPDRFYSDPEEDDALVYSLDADDVRAGAGEPAAESPAARPQALGRASVRLEHLASRPARIMPRRADQSHRPPHDRLCSGH